MTSGVQRCRRKFLRFFREGFYDETYIAWERGYKAEAHERWNELLGDKEFRRLLKAGEFDEIARRAVTIESRTNLLFSFEKMALRDAVRIDRGAQTFAEGLYEFVYGKRKDPARFERWIATAGALPRRQTRVLTWPVVTVFGFIARPGRDIFLKPNVTRRDLSDLRPRDMIDLQSFMWVQGSDEYD